MLAKGDRQCEGAAQTRHYGRDRVAGFCAILDLARDEMGDHLAVGIAFQRTTVSHKFRPQLLVVFDNAVVHQRKMLGRVRMGVLGCRCAVRRPAGVRDTDIARRRIRAEFLDQIAELALGPAADQIAFVNCADACAVIAAIFHSLQPVDQPVRHAAIADYPDDSAHFTCSEKNPTASNAMRLPVNYRPHTGARADCSLRRLSRHR